MTVAAVLAIAILGGLLAGPASGFANHLCAAPIDISGTTHLPEWVLAVKEQDFLAYPAHVVLGTVLAREQCDNVAVGLQWVKAGAHARGDSQVLSAAKGLLQARQRSSSPGEFDASLCAYLRGSYATAEQAKVASLAHINCGWPAPSGGG